jgi:uncharacterized protein (DUF305 family)
VFVTAWASVGYRRARVVGRIVAAAIAIVVMAGCASPSEERAGISADGTDFDNADVTFATAMVPHHAQAIMMARMVPAHGASAHVRELAQQIIAEQIPEIVQMQDLLSEWGRPAAPTASMSPSGGTAAMGGMAGMDGTDAALALAQGMMTDQQMQALTASSGPTFDQLFLQLMITHHDGAVAMAKTELSDGEDTDAQVLAQNISDGQLAQITLMQQLLATG